MPFLYRFGFMKMGLFFFLSTLWHLVQRVDMLCELVTCELVTCELVTKSCAFTITFGKHLTKLLTHHIQSAVKSQSDKKNFDFKILRKTLKR